MTWLLDAMAGSTQDRFEGRIPLFTESWTDPRSVHPQPCFFCTVETLNVLAEALAPRILSLLRTHAAEMEPGSLVMGVKFPNLFGSCRLAGRTDCPSEASESVI
jgi:hypothetical protein